MLVLNFIDIIEGCTIDFVSTSNLMTWNFTHERLAEHHTVFHCCCCFTNLYFVYLKNIFIYLDLDLFSVFELTKRIIIRIQQHKLPFDITTPVRLFLISFFYWRWIDVERHAFFFAVSLQFLSTVVKLQIWEWKQKEKKLIYVFDWKRKRTQTCILIHACIDFMYSIYVHYCTVLIQYKYKHESIYSMCLCIHGAGTHTWIQTMK